MATPCYTGSSVSTGPTCETRWNLPLPPSPSGGWFVRVDPALPTGAALRKQSVEIKLDTNSPVTLLFPLTERCWTGAFNLGTAVPGSRRGVADATLAYTELSWHSMRPLGRGARPTLSQASSSPRSVGVDGVLDWVDQMMVSVMMRGKEPVGGPMWQLLKGSIESRWSDERRH